MSSILEKTANQNQVDRLREEFWTYRWGFVAALSAFICMVLIFGASVLTNLLTTSEKVSLTTHAILIGIIEMTLIASGVYAFICSERYRKKVCVLTGEEWKPSVRAEIKRHADFDSRDH